MTLGPVLGATSTPQGLVMMAAAFTIEWGLATFMAILIFQHSMYKADVKPAHVARCVIYCFDFPIWPAIALTIVLLVQPLFDELNVQLDLIMTSAGLIARVDSGDSSRRGPRPCRDFV